MSAAESRLVLSGARRRADRAEGLLDQRLRPLHVGTGLQGAPAGAELVAQRLQLAAPGVRRGERAGPAHVPVELVEEQLLGGHPDEAGVERLGEHLLHPPLLGLGGHDLLAGRPVQAHGRGAHVGVADERGQVGAERERLQRGDVLVRGAPALVLVDRRDHVPPRDRLDAAEQVAGVHAVRRAPSTASTSRGRSSSRRGAPTPRARAPRAPRRRSACGCRPCPGSTHLSVASTTSGQPVVSSGSADTATTRPSRMPRWRTAEGAPVPSNQRPSGDDGVERRAVRSVHARIEPD